MRTSQNYFSALARGGLTSALSANNRYAKFFVDYLPNLKIAKVLEAGHRKGMINLKKQCFKYSRKKFYQFSIKFSHMTFHDLIFLQINTK